MDKRDLWGNFSSTEMRQIQIGMDYEDVQEILGDPYQITSIAGLHDLTCKQQKPRLTKDIDSKSDIKQLINQKFSETNYCCEGNKRVTLVYTKRQEIAKHDPMLWIHLDSNFQVENVFVKQYDRYLGFHDACIYNLSADKNFETTELFERNFK